MFPSLTTQPRLNHLVGRETIIHKQLGLDDHDLPVKCLAQPFRTIIQRIDLSLFGTGVKTVSYSILTDARSIIVLCITLQETYLINNVIYAD